MSSLREQIIRLAYTKPQLREHLLPLVVKQASAGTTSVGPHTLVNTGDALIIVSEWAKNHVLEGHTEVGQGSVFSSGFGVRDIISALGQLSASDMSGGRVHEISSSGVGYDLVAETRDIMQKFPNAERGEVQKEEGGSMITVPAFRVDASINSIYIVISTLCTSSSLSRQGRGKNF